MSETNDMESGILPKEAGIAIGPILFIIAILGILASAIAAGSSSFSTGTLSESHKAKATAIIDIGMNLKIGFERIVGNGVDFSAVNVDPTATTGQADLFSPLGGGITAPSTTMAATPSSDVWYYPYLAIRNLGTATTERVAVLKVNLGVCDQLNVKINAMNLGTATSTEADLGDFTSTTNNAVADWPTEFNGKMSGCVRNTNTTTTGYYFYQVLGIR